MSDLISDIRPHCTVFVLEKKRVANLTSSRSRDDSPHSGAASTTFPARGPSTNSPLLPEDSKSLRLTSLPRRTSFLALPLQPARRQSQQRATVSLSPKQARAALLSPVHRPPASPVHMFLQVPRRSMRQVLRWPELLLRLLYRQSRPRQLVRQHLAAQVAVRHLNHVPRPSLPRSASHHATVPTLTLRLARSNCRTIPMSMVSLLRCFCTRMPTSAPSASFLIPLTSTTPAAADRKSAPSALSRLSVPNRITLRATVTTTTTMARAAEHRVKSTRPASSYLNRPAVPTVSSQNSASPMTRHHSGVV